MEKNSVIHIEVAYATPEKQLILPLAVKEGCTILEAILTSGIQSTFPEIDLNTHSVGVFGKLKQFSDVLKSGDRLEIYRPLQINPMEARRLRAKKRKN